MMGVEQLFQELFANYRQPRTPGEILTEMEARVAKELAKKAGTEEEGE